MDPKLVDEREKAMTLNASLRRSINPETLSKPVGYCNVVETHASRLAFISGQVALDAQGNLVGAGDLRAQTVQVFENLKAALGAVGASFDDVVKVTYFLVDIGQMQAVRDVRNGYLNPAALPASTAVQVGGLVRKEFLVEIEAVAALGE